MKRSQVIKLIEDILKSGYDYPAITILDKLENIGMLPPPFIFIHRGEVFTNRWEDEKSKVKNGQGNE